MVSTSRRFEEKTAIVTGAGQGMGRAIALGLARESGRVVVNDIRRETALKVADEIVQEGGHALPVAADVTDKAQIDSLVNATLEKFGCIDILINNAGLLFSTPVEEIGLEEWNRVLSVNLTAPFLLSQAVMPAMRARHGGQIVNVASSAGRSTSELGGIHYTASKTGLLGLSRHLAREWAQYNINVNAVCPGLIETPMIAANNLQDRLDFFLGQIPLDRLGKCQDVADLVLFLASDESSYITGATIDINGGSLMI